MLLELSISDFAIIERSTIRFSEGLSALTGETGAGKSILLDALGAVLGARVSSDSVRTGAKAAHVEAAFAVSADTVTRIAPVLDELGIELDDEGILILAREILASGRSIARVNGRLSTAGALGRLGGYLVDIHGQSEHLAILKPVEQRNLLDRFGGLEPDRANVGSRVREWRAIRARIAEISGNAREREQRIDLLRFQADEIEGAALSPGEDNALVHERDILRNADRLRADALGALVALTADDMSEGPTVTELLRGLVASTADIASLDSGASDLNERANEVLVLAEDLARDLRGYAEGIDSDEQRLAEVEDRIDTLQALKRKYGATLDDVLAFGDRARRELDALTSGQFDAAELEAREGELASEIAHRAVALSSRRREAAQGLANAIEQSIAELNMGRAQLEIAVTHRDEPNGLPVPNGDDTRSVRVDESGIDEVEFLIAPNAGEALKPLNRIASGGETARLMLAAKSILSGVDLTPTLVFDEIDVGVGGRSGQVVGEKLWHISRQHQVIVVTHLPQIASFAETHLRIEKRAVSDRTVSEVRTLEGDDRLLELAAMLDGVPVTKAALLGAREMFERSQGIVAARSNG